MGVEPTRLPLLRGLIGIAAAIIILAGMKWGTEIVSPILMGITLALLLGPIYAWLRRHTPGWLALIGVIVFLILIFWFLFELFARSAESLRAGLTGYTIELQAHIDALQSSIKAVGINVSNSDVETKALIGVVTIIIDAIVSMLVYFFPVLILCLFFLAEGDMLFQRATKSLPDNPVLMRLSTFGHSIARQFGVRGIVNAITGAGFALLLILLGVDYAVLWGVLTFFLSYVPYIGIVIAGTPAVILAFAEFGLERALLVVLALTLVNVSAENLLAPSLMGRGLNLSTTVTFIGFLAWVWLFGAPGAFLAMPLTILTVLLLDSFPETKWLANIAMRIPDAAPTAQAAENPLSTSPTPSKRRK